MVAGDVVNTAARLQSAAPVNGVLVGEARTARRSARSTTARRRRSRRRARRSRSRSGRPCRPARASASSWRRAAWRSSAACASSSCSTGALARVREESAPQLLTLVGVPGIGKSRLVRELFDAVSVDPELITWRQGRSLPYGEGVTYWALAEMVKAEAGILESDDADEVEAKLARAVTSTVDDDEAEWVQSHLRPLVRMSDDVESRGDTRAEAFAAWRRFFEGLGDRGPAVLVFEDLHWADDGLLDFIDHLVDWASRRPASARLHRAAGAAGAPAGVGRRQAQRDDGLALAALAGRDRAACPRAARPGRAIGRRPGGAAGTRRREPALRRGVRPRSPPSGATWPACRCPSRCRG